jgi:hypothetical protein
MSQILYLTDTYGVSDGYKPAFERLLNKAGIHRHQVVLTSIYNLVEKPLKKRGNEVVWRFDPEKLPQIRAAFAQRVKSIKPRLIVVSCPACLGVLSDGDLGVATLDKMRGGVYYYEGIPCIVTYPITAIHQRIDERILRNDDGEEDKQQPYRVPQGGQILAWDWQKVGRFFAGKQRIVPAFRYSVVRSLADALAARDYLKDARLIAEDIETGNYPPQITCVGFTGILANGAMHSFVFPFYDEFAPNGCYWQDETEHALVWSIVRDINDSPVPKTMQNGGYDCSYFIRDRAPPRNYLLDLMILWWSLYMEMPKRLDFICSILLDNYQYWKDDIKGEENESIEQADRSMERYWRYNALDCYNTLLGTLFMLKLLSGNRAMQKAFQDAMLRNFTGLRMSMRGLKADQKRRDFHRKNLVAEMNRETEKLRFLLDDPEFNINSGPQKCSLLYDVFGLPERTARGKFVDQAKQKTGKNAPSAGAIPVMMAKTEHPLFAYILNPLEKALAPRVQMSNLFGFPDPDAPSGVRGGIYMPTGRFRYSLNPVGTETTRFSGKKSNFWEGTNPQNIRGDYKDWIVSDEITSFSTWITHSRTTSSSPTSHKIQIRLHWLKADSTHMRLMASCSLESLTINCCREENQRSCNRSSHHRDSADQQEGRPWVQLSDGGIHSLRPHAARGRRSSG